MVSPVVASTVQSLAGWWNREHNACLCPTNCLREATSTYALVAALLTEDHLSCSEASGACSIQKHTLIQLSALYSNNNHMCQLFIISNFKVPWFHSHNFPPRYMPLPIHKTAPPCNNIIYDICGMLLTLPVVSRQICNWTIEWWQQPSVHFIVIVYNGR